MRAVHMNGVLLIDKPSGMTSHDVVAWARRTLGVRRLGHAGTLDPMATGLLVALVGQATRLSPYLTGKDKTYDAAIQLGLATTTDDADGVAVGDRGDAPEDDALIQAALDGFVGTQWQVPPAFSAKKVGGQIAYDLARRDVAVALAPVEVTIREILDVRRAGDIVRLRVTASAGFYVRALARDLGRRLGCGAHLVGLRRVRSGDLDVADAVGLAEGSGLGPALAGRLMPMAEALPDLPAVRVTDSAMARVAHGNFVGPAHLGAPIPGEDGTRVRLLGPAGELVALADLRRGVLHPVVVLG